MEVRALFDQKRWGDWVVKVSILIVCVIYYITWCQLNQIMFRYPPNVLSTKILCLCEQNGGDILNWLGFLDFSQLSVIVYAFSYIFCYASMISTHALNTHCYYRAKFSTLYWVMRMIYLCKVYSHANSIGIYSLWLGLLSAMKSDSWRSIFSNIGG